VKSLRSQALGVLATFQTKQSRIKRSLLSAENSLAQKRLGETGKGLEITSLRVQSSDFLELGSFIFRVYAILKLQL
jgi:hypothetical protein